jgi:hypothetical protein
MGFYKPTFTSLGGTTLYVRNHILFFFPQLQHLGFWEAQVEPSTQVAAKGFLKKSLVLHITTPKKNTSEKNLGFLGYSSIMFHLYLGMRFLELLSWLHCIVKSL